MAYAGIGSRETPPEILDLIEVAATFLAEEGHVLRSGHAPGADQAFERGAGSKADIYLPWKGFERQVPIQGNTILCTDEAIEHARDYHPNWPALSFGGRKLMGRNSQIILGGDLKHPVKFVLCWCPIKYGKWSGGTAQGLRIADAYDIPIHNLFIAEEREYVEQWVSKETLS